MISEKQIEKGKELLKRLDSMDRDELVHELAVALAARTVDGIGPKNARAFVELVRVMKLFGC